MRFSSSSIVTFGVILFSACVSVTTAAFPTCSTAVKFVGADYTSATKKLDYLMTAANPVIQGIVDLTGVLNEFMNLPSTERVLAVNCIKGKGAHFSSKHAHVNKHTFDVMYGSKVVNTADSDVIYFKDNLIVDLDCTKIADFTVLPGSGVLPLVKHVYLASRMLQCYKTDPAYATINDNDPRIAHLLDNTTITASTEVTTLMSDIQKNMIKDKITLGNVKWTSPHTGTYAGVLVELNDPTMLRDILPVLNFIFEIPDAATQAEFETALSKFTRFNTGTFVKAMANNPILQSKPDYKKAIGKHMILTDIRTLSDEDKLHFAAHLNGITLDLKNSEKYELDVEAANLGAIAMKTFNDNKDISNENVKNALAISNEIMNPTRSLTVQQPFFKDMNTTILDVIRTHSESLIVSILVTGAAPDSIYIHLHKSPMTELPSNDEMEANYKAVYGPILTLMATKTGSMFGSEAVFKCQVNASYLANMTHLTSLLTHFQKLNGALFKAASTNAQFELLQFAYKDDLKIYSEMTKLEFEAIFNHTMNASLPVAYRLNPHFNVTDLNEVLTKSSVTIGNSSAVTTANNFMSRDEKVALVAPYAGHALVEFYSTVLGVPTPIITAAAANTVPQPDSAESVFHFTTIISLAVSTLVASLIMI
jgi:hypothetical protein